MTYREVEQLDGIGTILRADGSEVGQRRYHLTVLQRMHDAGRGETIAGMLRVEGRIVLEGFEGMAFVTEGSELTLKLEDGRSLPFFSNSDGRIAPRGGLK